MKAATISPVINSETSGNPLLQAGAAPRFDHILPSHVGPAIRVLIERLAQDIDAIEASCSPCWEATIAAITRISEGLSFAWGTIGHLMAVANQPDLRAAHQACQGDVVAISMRLAQSRPLYQAMRALRDGNGWAGLDATQQRILTAAVRQAEQAGVGLEGAERERFQAIEMALAEASTRFSNQLLDANKAFSLTLTGVEDIAGLPASLLASAAQPAASGQAVDPARGPWRITLDAPLYIPFMEHSRRRDLREHLYRAFITRASSDPADNQPLIHEILALRQEKAQLLGYASFAELSLASKMAPGIAAVETLLGQLREVALPRARHDLEELTAHARRLQGDPGLELSPWDTAFWAERLREERYAYREEEVRPYFPLPAVLAGLWTLAERLFGVVIEAADGEVPVWDPAVRYFRVRDSDGGLLAHFYLDPYSRPENKRGGAWMDNALDRQVRADGTLRLPLVYLVCNQSPPVGDIPSLMTLREVETLFHEFGHGLQAMLTRVDRVEAAGINGVEWDAVELPSQMMENWCYHAPTMLGSSGMGALARHHRTGEPLPTALFERIVAGRSFRSGSATLRQVYLASIDLALHRMPGAAAADRVVDRVLALQFEVLADHSVLPPLAEDRHLCGFSHIFSGGYAAGYYSYKWAEILAADAFAAFMEAGSADPSALAVVGRRFRETVLALGGSKHPMEVFIAFRGREPSLRPLMIQTGLAS